MQIDLRAMGAATSRFTPLKLHRVRRGMSQAELAKLVGVSASWISLLERGLVDPKDDLAEKLSLVLGVGVEVLWPVFEDAP
jgi:transcriptional regulator with XRE-family HTH domain